MVLKCARNMETNSQVTFRKSFTKQIINKISSLNNVIFIK